MPWVSPDLLKSIMLLQGGLLLLLTMSHGWSC